MQITPHKPQSQLLDHHSNERTWLPVILLALVYTLLGRASLLMAIPPGFSIAIFPPAGLALGIIFTLGFRYLPGIALGSFLVNLLVLLEYNPVIGSKEVMTATFVACGATLQAYVAGKLLQSKFGGHITLDTNKKILQFFIYGGIVACLISCTVGVSTLYVMGALPAEKLLSNWLAWWGGDVFGVLTISPIILVLFGEPRSIWFARRWSIIIPLLSCLFLVVGLFTFTRYQEQRKQQNDFRVYAEHISQKLQIRFDQLADVIRNTEQLFASSGKIDRDGFENFVRYHVKAHPSIQFLAYAPRVANDQKNNFELAVQNEGISNYKILPEGTYSTTQKDYFPIYYAETQSGLTRRYGLDLGSNPRFRSAIERAQQMGRLTASDPFQYAQQDKNHIMVMLFAAMKGTSQDGKLLNKNEATKGVVAAAILFDELIKSVISSAEQNKIYIKFYDANYPTGSNLIINTLPEKTDAYLYQTTLNFGERQYVLSLFPSNNYMDENVLWVTWTSLIGGLLFTGLLGAYLLMSTAHSYGIEAMVVQRTTELHNSEERLQAIFDHAADGILTTNEAGVIDASNRSIQQLLGYKESELIGHSLLMLFPDAISQNFLRQHLYLEAENGNYNPRTSFNSVRGELTGKTREGNEIPLEISLTPVRIAGKIFLVITMHDLTEKRRVEKLKTEFVSAVSHELRTPLTSIRGVLGLLVGGIAGSFPDKVKTMLNMANENAIRLTNLVNDLLDFERLEYGSMQFYLDTLSLPDLVQKTIQANQGFAHNFNVTIHFESSEIGDLQVMTDPKRFSQVLSNLLSNAIKFSREGEIVDVRIVRQNDIARIEVQDYGIGISKAFQAQIFQKFTQEDARSTRKYAGTGLGLSLSKTLIEKMGGSIGFTSVEGEGSTFYINLPVIKQLAVTEA